MEMDSPYGIGSTTADYLAPLLMGGLILLAAALALVMMYRVARDRTGAVVALVWVVSFVLLLPLSAGIGYGVSIPFWMMSMSGSNDPQAGMGAGMAIIGSVAMLAVIISAILTGMAAGRGRKKRAVP